MTIKEAMKRRICQPTTFTGKPEDAIKHLLEENIVNPKNAKRKISLFNKVKADITTDKSIHFALDAPECLSDVIGRICEVHGINVTSDSDAIFIAC